MKKSTIMITVSLSILVIMIAKAFVFDEEVKYNLLIFTAVGLGLSLLRLFVNGSIKKMKGKHIGVKILFFAVLLGLGIPFQNWFRKEVILSMDSNFILPSIIVAIASMILFTLIYGRFHEKVRLPHLIEK